MIYNKRMEYGFIAAVSADVILRGEKNEIKPRGRVSVKCSLRVCVCVRVPRLLSAVVVISLPHAVPSLSLGAG